MNVCLQCGDSLAERRNIARWCSGKCRQKYLRGSFPINGRRRCRWCSVSLNGRRANARWCSVKCRTYWTRRLDRARAERAARKPSACGHCNRPIVQPRTSRRIYCSVKCREAAYAARNPDAPAPPVEPFPLPFTGHEWFVIARQAAGISGGYSGGASGLTHHQVDWGQHDILADAVLAIAEGRDPSEAVRKRRALDKADRLRREWGVLDYGQDEEGNIITVKDYDGD